MVQMIPKDPLQIISKDFDPEFAWTLRRVCKAWKMAIDDPTFWCRIICRDLRPDQCDSLKGSIKDRYVIKRNIRMGKSTQAEINWTSPSIYSTLQEGLLYCMCNRNIVTYHLDSFKELDNTSENRPYSRVNNYLIYFGSNDAPWKIYNYKTDVTLFANFPSIERNDCIELGNHLAFMKLPGVLRLLNFETLSDHTINVKYKSLASKKIEIVEENIVIYDKNEISGYEITSGNKVYAISSPSSNLKIVGRYLIFTNDSNSSSILAIFNGKDGSEVKRFQEPYPIIQFFSNAPHMLTLRKDTKIEIFNIDENKTIFVFDIPEISYASTYVMRIIDNRILMFFKKSDEDPVKIIIADLSTGRIIKKLELNYNRFEVDNGLISLYYLQNETVRRWCVVDMVTGDILHQEDISCDVEQFHFENGKRYDIKPTGFKRFNYLF